jgi:hypothetical protein
MSAKFLKTKVPAMLETGMGSGFDFVHVSARKQLMDKLAEFLKSLNDCNVEKEIVNQIFQQVYTSIFVY